MKLVKNKKKIFYAIAILFFAFVSLPIASSPPFIAVPTGSMVPALNVGDLVRVKKINPAEIKVGDVVVVEVPEETQKKYRYPSSIIHRVSETKPHEIYGNMYRTKGDTNKVEDPFTAFPENIRGKEDGKIPYLGFAVLFMHSVNGKVFLCGAFFLFVFYDSINWTKRNKSKMAAAFRQKVRSLLYQDILEELEMLRRSLQKGTLEKIETAPSEEKAEPPKAEEPMAKPEPCEEKAPAAPKKQTKKANRKRNPKNRKWKKK